ncbi:MAG: Methionyl-tRNA synthetase, partial [uncultured Chloroflexi bacterium]
GPHLLHHYRNRLPQRSAPYRPFAREDRGRRGGAL